MLPSRQPYNPWRRLQDEIRDKGLVICSGRLEFLCAYSVSCFYGQMCSLLLYILSIISTTARQCYCMFTFFVLKPPPLVGFSLKNVIHCVIFTVVTSYTCVFRPDTLDNKSERCHTHYCLWTPILYSFIQTCTRCKPKTKPQWYAGTVGQILCPRATDVRTSHIISAAAGIPPETSIPVCLKHRHKNVQIFRAAKPCMIYVQWHPQLYHQFGKCISHDIS